jgi:hypothetical protein
LFDILPQLIHIFSAPAFESMHSITMPITTIGRTVLCSPCLKYDDNNNNNNQRRRRLRSRRTHTLSKSTKSKSKSEDEEEERRTTNEAVELLKAMENARENEKRQESPGAGLSSEDSAVAAFADMINTSLNASTNQNRKKSIEDIKSISIASEMSIEAKRGKSEQKMFAVVGDFLDLFWVLIKGAHIVKKKDGRV